MLTPAWRPQSRSENTALVDRPRIHGPVGRAESNEVLVPDCPLTDDQKRTKVQDLIQEARKSGRIVDRGSGSGRRGSADATARTGGTVFNSSIARTHFSREVERLNALWIKDLCINNAIIRHINE